MNIESKYWKWKNTIIDFNTISDEKDEYSKYMTKKDMVFRYLGTPDEDIHEWYNGGWSSEYNTALKYAKELGLVEDYIDYDDKLYEKDKEIERLNNQLDFIKDQNKYIDKLEKMVKERNSIIKEVREYLPKLRVSPSYELDDKIDNLLEILDKVEENK